MVALLDAWTGQATFQASHVPISGVEARYGRGREVELFLSGAEQRDKTFLLKMSICGQGF